MKKSASKKSFLTFATVVVLALIVVTGIISNEKNGRSKLFYLQEKPQNNKNNITQLNSYPALSFSIKIPLGYSTEEKYTTVSLNNDKGNIIVSRIATNFPDLKSHLADLNKKNKVTVIIEKYLTVDNNQAVDRTIKYPGNSVDQERVYNIYVNNLVYSISTKSKDLYSDLDQIAQSFRYTP